MEKTLTSIYLDPSQPAGFRGLDAVYREVKEKGKNKITRKQVRDWLSQQDVYTLHKSGRRRYKRSRVIVSGIDAQFQADLVDLQNLSRYNKGYKLGAPNENIVQIHLNIALLKVFQYLNGRYRHIFIP